MAHVTLIDVDVAAAVRAGAAPPTALANVLEAGEIVALPTPNLLSSADLACLREPHQVAGAHKNIAYDAPRNRLTGIDGRNARADMLRRALRSYATRITAIVAHLLPAYAEVWRSDLTSFRPLEEAQRHLSDRSRNDRLHIDAFPSRPTNGDRILRVFTNVHPAQPRVWLTAEPLHVQLPVLRGLPHFPSPLLVQPSVSGWRQWLARRLRIPALARSPYDRFMLRLHDFMKQSAAYQESCTIVRHAFAPDTTWIVFTDIVPHAVVSGQYALEHTFIVPHSATNDRASAPLTLFNHLNASVTQSIDSNRSS